MSDRYQHYLDTLGNVPLPISRLHDLAEPVGAAYTQIRELAYAPASDGLSLAMKELVFVILDIVHHNASGARNHLAAARRAGLTEQQFRDALLIVFMMTGMSTWGTLAADLWADFSTDEPDDSAADG